MFIYAHRARCGRVDFGVRKFYSVSLFTFLAVCYIIIV